MDDKEKSLAALDAALDAARKRAGSEETIFSVVFPPLPESAFSALADVPANAKFFIENRLRAIAVCGLEICTHVPAGQKIAREIFGGEAPLLFFCAIPFAKNAAPSDIARWQISKRAGTTQIAYNFLLHKEKKSAKAIFDAYKKLLETRVSPLLEPQFSAPAEVGGDWYLAAAKHAINTIKAGEIQKIVLARARDFSASSEIQADVLRKKLQQRFGDKNCTIFSFSDTPEKTFLGATPEMLVHVSAGTLETEAVAGSIPNNGEAVSTLAEKILTSEKERREHASVVDFIMGKLHTLGAIPEKISSTPEVLVLPNVLHLRTPIRAKLPAGTTAGTLVRALHPTPAMCGVPVNKARAAIAAAEPFPRENFAGPLGFFDERGDGFFCVGIRCAKIAGTTMRLYAGSGIVLGSSAEREFLEINAKFDAIPLSPPARRVF